MPELEAISALNAVGGVGAVLGGVALFFARRDALQHNKVWRQSSERQEQLSRDLINIVQENTSAFTSHTEVMRTVTPAIRELREEIMNLQRARPA